MPQKKGRSSDSHKIPQRNVQPAKQPKGGSEKPVSADSLKGKDMSNYKQIVNHYDNRNYKQGLRLSLQFLKHQPMVADVVAFKGLFMQNLTSDGVAIIKSAVKMDPDNYMPEYLLGLGYKDCDKTLKAIQHLENARKLYSGGSKDSNSGICNELIQLYSTCRNYKACLGLVESLDDSVYKQNSLVYYNFLLGTLEEKLVDDEITKELTSSDSTNVRKEQLAAVAILAFQKPESVKKYIGHIQTDDVRVQIQMGIGKPFVYSEPNFDSSLTAVLKHYPDSLTYQMALLAKMLAETQRGKQKAGEAPSHKGLSQTQLQEFVSLFCKTKYSSGLKESSPPYAQLFITHPSMSDHTDIQTSDISLVYEYVKSVPEVVRSWHEAIIGFGSCQITSALLLSLCLNDASIVLDRMEAVGKPTSPKEFKVLLRMGKIELYDSVRDGKGKDDRWFYIGMLRQEGKCDEAYDVLLKEFGGPEVAPEPIFIEKLRLEILLMNNQSEKHKDVAPAETAGALLSHYGTGNRFLTSLCVHKLLMIRSCGPKSDVFMFCVNAFSKFIRGDWLCNLYDMQDFILLGKFATYLHNRNKAGVTTELPYSLNKHTGIPIAEQFSFSLHMRLLTMVEQFVSHQVDYFRYVLRRNLITEALMLTTTVRNTFKTPAMRRVLGQISSVLTKEETSKHLISVEKREDISQQALEQFRKTWDQTGQTAQDIEYEKVRNAKDVLFINVNVEKALGRIESLHALCDAPGPGHYVWRLLILAQFLLLESPEASAPSKLGRAGLLLVQQTALGRLQQMLSALPRDAADCVKAVAQRVVRLLQRKLPASELVGKKLATYGFPEKCPAPNTIDLGRMGDILGFNKDEVEALSILLKSVESSAL